MPTRELIHVSFGSLPAHLSAQFFNTQTGYFNYSPSAPEPLVDHDVSWQEGVDGRRQERYTPRWLVYDVKDGFEGLRREEIYDDDEDDVGQEGQGPHATSSWTQPAEVMRTGSKTHSTPFRALANRERRGEDVNWDEELEKEFDTSDEEDEDEETNPQANGSSEPKGHVQEANTEHATSSQAARRTRPWSSRLLFELNPRTLVPVTASGGLPLHSMSVDASSNAPEGVEVFESFEQGWSRAKEWERDNDTLDTSLRFLLEAADQPQGFNLMHQSTDAWSGFSHWNLEQLVDDFPKLDKLVWSIRWGEGLGHLSSDGDDDDDARLRAARIRSMNEALSLLLMGEGSSLYTPLNLPEWSEAETESPGWTRHLRSDKKQKLYNDESYWSSLVANHFETATLGMRLRNSPTSAATLTSHLNWRGDTKLAQLGGCLPIPLLAPMADEDSRPLDPVEALLASRGYNPRPGQSRGSNTRFDPAEIGRMGAKEIVKSWTSFSAAPAPLLRRRQKHQSKRQSSDTKHHLPKPFALQAVARDAQKGAQAITESSTEQWISGDREDGCLGLDEPWGRSLFTPLDQPLPASTKPLYSSLTSSGRPWPRSSSSSTSLHESRPKSLPLLSTFSTTPSSHAHIMHAISTLTTALRSHTPLASYGLVGSSAAPRNTIGGGGISAGQAANDEIEGVIGGLDGLKEVLERAEEMRAAYEDEESRHDEDEGRGTDEEWGDTEPRDAGDDDLDWD